MPPLGYVLPLLPFAGNAQVHGRFVGALEIPAAGRPGSTVPSAYWLGRRLFKASKSSDTWEMVW